jgi:succinate dehydrogenase / fumarate reductase iron-sulfur subunit
MSSMSSVCATQERATLWSWSPGARGPSPSPEACIGCSACVAQCPNGAAQLFTSAKVSHLGFLPQGQPEQVGRAVSMVEAMEEQGFGSCTNDAECEAVCPKGISIDFIARMHRDYIKAKLKGVGKVGAEAAGE